MKITASQYINNSRSEKSFTGIFHYTRPMRSKHDSYTEMYGLFSISSEVNIPGKNIGKFAWDGIVDGFEYSKKESVNEAVKVALTESTRRIKQLIANDTNISSHGVDINLTIFVSSGGGIYVGSLGDNDIYIYKKGRIVDISEMLGKKKAKTAALVIDSKDILFSSSKGFLKKNINRLITLSGNNEFINALEGISDNLGLNEGLLVITKSNGEVVKNVKKEVVNVQADVKPTESLNSDYIPTERVVPKKVVKKEERDLKGVFSSIWSLVGKVTPLFLSIKGVVLKVFSLIGIKLKSLWNVLGSNVSSMFSNKKWFKKVSATFSQSSLGSKRGGGFKGIKIDGYKDRDKKVQRFKMFFVVILTLCVLVFGIKFTMDQREARRVSRQANEIFVSVGDFVSKAEDSSRTDRESTEMFVYRAQEELAKVPESLGEKDRIIYEELSSRVLAVEDILYKRVVVKDSDSSIETYIDTRLAFGDNSKPRDIAIHRDSRANEYLLITDSGLKGVFRVSLYNKEVRKLPDNDGVLQEPAMIYVGRSGIFVLDLKVGVVRAEFDGDGWFKPFTKLTGLGIENIDAKDIAEFAVLTDSDNVYILDRAKKSLLKSSNFGSGYGLSFPYITNDAFETANEVLADLSVYILTSGADGLHRYNFSFALQNQVLAPVTVVGIDGEFKNLSFGYTMSDLDYDLYLFDSIDKRVFRFTKPKEGGGEIRHPNQVVLKNQYLYRGDREKVWDDVRDFVVNREQKNMYILDSSTVWKIRL